MVPKHYLLLFKRLLLILGLFSLLRLLFFIFNLQNFSSFGFDLAKAFTAGLIFDASAGVYCYSLFILLHIIPLNIRNKAWWQSMTLWLFMLISFMVSLLNLIDVGFFPIKGKRTGVELFSLVTDKSNPIGSYVIHYWYLALILLAVCYFTYRLYPRLKYPLTGFRWQELLWLPPLCAVMFLAARGGLGLKPIRSFDAARFVPPGLVHLTINTPFQVISTIQARQPERIVYMNTAEAETLVQPYKQYYQPGKRNDKPNVVIIILESFGRSYCGYLMDSTRFTPFLDSLSKQSLVFTHAYANGTTSIESVPAILASIPSLMEIEYINSGFQSNKAKNVAWYLKQGGYDCSFYLGASNGSMGFDNFLSITGPVQYFGLNEYPNKADHDGAWGIWDEPYLQYYAQQLNKKTQPFFSTVFTLSSHDPYNVPSTYKNMFPGGKLPIYKTIQYTDMALRKFFETASKQPWFSNTLFVITADHASHSETEYFYSPQGRMEIPILFYKPNEIKPLKDTTHSIVQADIMPSILDWVNYEKPFFAMGNSVFDTLQPHFAAGYHEGYYQLVEYPYVARLSHHGETKFYTQRTNTLNRTARYVLTPEEEKKRDMMLRRLRAYIQVYNNRLLDNTFY